ncbi:hypothetical protein LTR06_005493 [Exophiala xenobiotica]|nr:hypothetical protein LTR06_005493 [Exophiala xenobiotica]
MSSFDSYAGVKRLFVLGITTSTIASGGLLFTSYVHAPGYLKNTDDKTVLDQWQTMGAIGKVVVPPLALVASGANFLNAYFTHTQPQHYRFLTAGALSLVILPYTFLALGSTNAELASRAERKEVGLRPESGLRDLSIRDLIQRWSERSAVRGFLLLASALVSCDADLVVENEL